MLSSIILNRVSSCGTTSVMGTFPSFCAAARFVARHEDLTVERTQDLISEWSNDNALTFIGKDSNNKNRHWTAYKVPVYVENGEDVLETDLSHKTLALELLYRELIPAHAEQLRKGIKVLEHCTVPGNVVITVIQKALVMLPHLPAENVIELVNGLRPFAKIADEFSKAIDNDPRYSLEKLGSHYKTKHFEPCWGDLQNAQKLVQNFDTENSL